MTDSTLGNISLLTDFYQLTMGQAFFSNDMVATKAVFTMYFRDNPFAGGYAIAAGLAEVVEFLQNYKFTNDDIKFLQARVGSDNKPLFTKDYLAYLKNMQLDCEILAAPEGSVVFANEPMLRITAPIIQAQLLETAILNIINFQTLIATKASRVVRAAYGSPVVEFGLRRAQGISGGIAASRAAYIGGVSATSNVYAAKKFNIPVMGTHSHSWVMAFDNEPDAFSQYAKAMPNNCTFLIDTYTSRDGVQNAIKVAAKYCKQPTDFAGIRLDSGNLLNLSKYARKELDQAGFKDTKIIASSDLDEYIIGGLLAKGAPIDVWGVGTRLATSYNQPALGGVYKLSGIYQDGVFNPRIKLSDTKAKGTTPGLLQVKRYKEGAEFIGDVIFDASTNLSDMSLVAIDDTNKKKTFSNSINSYELLVPVWRKDKLVNSLPSIEQIRAKAHSDLMHLPDEILALHPQRVYFCGLEENLYNKKQEMITNIKN